MPENSRQTKQGAPSLSAQEELRRLSGSNPVLNYMIQRGLPLTRAKYIRLNWGQLPEEVDDEDERRVLELLP